MKKKKPGRARPLFLAGEVETSRRRSFTSPELHLAEVGAAVRGRGKAAAQLRGAEPRTGMGGILRA